MVGAPQRRHPHRHALGALVAAILTAALIAAGTPPTAAAAVPDPYAVQVVQTSANLSQRLTALPAMEFGSRAQGHGLPLVPVNAAVRYQRIQGFGAAMTDTSAWLIQRGLPAAQRTALMTQLFGQDGIRLDFMRVPMGASDFTHTGRPYTYDDMPPGRSDPTLAHFSIAHDRAYILPALTEARALNPGLEFLASPWTAPAWMKGNDSLGNAGDLGTLRASAYRPWADYFARFITAYDQAGVPITALTLQNEPGTPTLYPGMNLSPAAESSWLLEDLEPSLAAARLAPQLYGGDLGWGPDSNAFMSGSIFGTAGRFLSGISWHCYYGAPGVMNAFRQAAPRLVQIVDECSPGGTSPTPTSENVIASLRDWASTVALWNVALDPTGGPVQIPNHGCPGCVGLATIDARHGTYGFTRSYYQLGQASAFIAPGAQRIASPHFVSYVYPHKGVNVVTPGLDDVAVRNPDGSIALIAYDNATVPIRFAIAWRGRALAYELTPGAMATFVWNR